MPGHFCEGLNNGANGSEDQSMTFAKSLVATFALSAIAAATGAAIAGETAIPAKVLGPLKAASYDIGSKHTLAYYEATGGACKVTVLLADKFDEKSDVYPAAVRFNTVIQGGTSDRVDSIDGPSLAFSCAPGATTLMVQTIDRVAYAKTQD